MKIRTSLTAISIGAGVLAAFPLTACAQTSVVVEAMHGLTFVNGGIGEQEQAAMHRLAKEFPLRMTFSERKDGEFLADIPVVNSDTHGNPVFVLSNAGPMLDVRLPNGSYKVNARFKGMSETQDVTIDGKESKELHFHWKGEPQ